MPTRNKLGGLSFSPNEASGAQKYIKEMDKQNAELGESRRRTARNEVQGMASYYHKKVFGKGEVFGKAGWDKNRDSTNNPMSVWDDIERFRLEDKRRQERKEALKRFLSKLASPLKGWFGLIFNHGGSK